ncbi:hypothetical protein DYB34_002476 [Aphanomyces astaci]|uniref:Uncharacterized protein n=2 Tax=Aphanomyces astaci TaxID=112090 RepID=A0A418BDN0_APHAT|nr:hypothetical protein DYB34_002476 [Aphanomyces astaci]
MTHHEKGTDKMLLHSMVRKSTRRLVRISTGHRLRDSIDTNDNPGPKFSLIQPADSHRLTRHLSILQERKYTVTDDTIKDEDGAEYPVALYLNDVQFFLSWSVAADGSSGQTACIASALEALVPSIAHYGYDTSMAECLGENHAVMHLAKWTIQVVPSAADNDLDDEKDELYVGGKENNTSPRHTKAAQWRLCVRDPMPPTHPTGPLHLAGSSAEKATVNLRQSHRRTTAYFSTKNDRATDQMETHLASRTHLAMIHNAQETHAVEYFAHKYKTTALASHT